jgi:cytoskeletal protein RodZ
MSKPSTDPGLGPPSSDDAQPAKKSDTVDDILDGFGTARADQPRILPKKSSDITPTPPEVGRKELTPTEPGSRQKQSRFVVAGLVGFAAVLVLGVALVKITGGGPENPDTVPTTAAPTDKSTAVMAPTAMIPVPTETATVDTAAPVSSASAAPSAKPTATAKTTAVAPSAKPSATATGSDQPGLHLIKGQ